MPLPRHIRQPGPVDPVRIESCEGTSQTVTFQLEPGLNLCDAIAAPLMRAGLTGAGVTLERIRFDPFRYVIPAFATDADHVAYYSETFAPRGPIDVDYANITFGQRDSRPFIHCHALWRDGTGRQRGGHVLPFDAMIASPGQAVAFGTSEVSMVSEFDPETNFTLFRPSPIAEATRPDPAKPCIIARIKPNTDLVESIETVCRHHQISNAVIRSGVGSIVGAEFEDGHVIEAWPTEILVLEGRIAPDSAGQPRADLTIALIDTNGDIHQGRPASGRNPVLICFELVLEPLDR